MRQQNDPLFYALLNNVKNTVITREDFQVLSTRFGDQPLPEGVGNTTLITSRNADVNNFNSQVIISIFIN